MKRARVTRSEAARARARPDALLALLDDADVAVGQQCASSSALASLTADLVARNNESLQLTVAQVVSVRSALLARKTRVLGSAKRLSRKQGKRIDADFEAVDVSTEQLRVWAGVAGAGAGVVCPDLNCVFAASPLLDSPRLVQSPAIFAISTIGLPFSGELSSVATGDGLRVVSAAGPGLKWFKPHSRNEFSVVLAHDDGSVPVWLTTDDVVVDILSLFGASVAAGPGPSVPVSAAVRSEWLSQGTVSVMYGCLSEDVPEAVLRLSVCGAPVADATGDCDWCVRVPRKPLAGHECAAVGTLVRTLAVVEGEKFGMAVSADEQWLVVGLVDEGTLSVYSLPEGELVRTFGGRGDGPLQFKWLRRLCFAPNGNLILVECCNQRLQEVTLEGVFVRVIGVGEFGDGQPICVAVHHDIIAVGCADGTGPRVVLFGFGTGAVMSRFGEKGTYRTAPGRLSGRCSGIRFTPDGSRVVVAEWEADRLSLFTTAGVFVRCVGVGVLGKGHMDVLQSVTGEYVVADNYNHRVCVFSPDGSELVRSWGSSVHPTALAVAGPHLYVMASQDRWILVFG